MGHRLPWKQLESILSALSALPSWRHVHVLYVKTSLFSDDMGGWGGWENWLQYSWAPDWVVQGQFCSTNVLADDSEVWPWLWHVTCTLETIFFYFKKKTKNQKNRRTRCGSLEGRQKDSQGSLAGQSGEPHARERLKTGHVWCRLWILAIGRQRRSVRSLRVQGQPGLCRKLQASQG